MAAILLDVDGVLHVSGEPIPGGAEAVARLREAGHRLRFVTNNTTRARSQLADELRVLGVDLEDEELQTTPRAAARALKGRRVLAMTMAAILDDLEGVELVGEEAEAVLLGGADETPETNRVFSYMNLARAFAEVDTGADLYCLHRNRWWQTSRATLLGKPSPSYFAAALEALDADPEMTWMVGDDVESDVAGAKGVGMRAVLVRTGKFRPDEVEIAKAQPDGIVSSIAELPDWLERELG